MKHPVDLDVDTQFGHFKIDPATVVAGEHDKVLDEIEWKSQHAFVVHFIDRTPLDETTVQSAPGPGGHTATAQVKAGVPGGRYDYAVALWKQNKVYLHISGEVRKWP